MTDTIDSRSKAFLRANIERRKELVAKLNGLNERAEGRPYSPDESRDINAWREEITAIDIRVDNLVSDEARAAEIAEAASASFLGRLSTRDEGSGTWAEQAGTALRRHIEERGLFASAFDVPQVVSSPVAKPQHPTRILDLVGQRPLDAATFTYLRQTVRTNNASTVADSGQKQTSVFTLTPVEDRPRVVAHLSEPFPQRFLEDYDQAVDFLDSEMRSGVLHELERLIVAGDSGGSNTEEFDGVLNTSGTIPVAQQANVWETLRMARTVLDASGVTPTAWAFNPSDLAFFDLAREDTAGQFLIGEGLSNIFGTHPRISSPAVPAGTALLGDWTRAQLWTRQSITLEANNSDAALFDYNLMKLRAEGRYGFGLLQPAAFAVVSIDTDES